MVIIQTEIKPEQSENLAFDLNLLTSTLRDRDLNVEPLLKKAMIPKNALRTPDYQLTFTQKLTFIQEALENLNTPCLGLDIGRQYHLSSYGLLGLTLINSLNLKQALTQLFKYILMTCTYVHWSVSVKDTVAILSPMVTPNLGNSYQYTIDQSLATSYNICSELLGTHLPLIEINLTQPESMFTKKYQEVFNCPVNFNQPANDLRFDESYLYQPLTTADPDSARVFALQCERICRNLAQGNSFTETVKQHLLAPGNKIRHLNAIASLFNTTPRTIQRKLAAEGTSFNSVLENIRKSISIEYLKTTNVSIENISIILGYSDAPNFSHAFKKWTGSSPGIYRKQFT